MDGARDNAAQQADRELLLSCMRASQSKGHFPDQGKVTALIEARAHHVALAMADAGIAVREDAPGYVCLKVGSRTYNFPYYLALVFPTTSDLEAIDVVVDQIRLAAANSFCLSGSSTSLRRVASISDIDFCEYFRGTASDLVSKLGDKGAPSARCLLAVLSISGVDHRRPFDGPLAQLAEELAIGNRYEELTRLKLDFIGTLEGRGHLALTNVVVPISRDDDPRLRQSFQFQEAVIHEDEARPGRPLILPEEIGTYLVWLRDEARDYLERAGKTNNEKKARSVFKALKRLMSWLLFVESEEDWEAIVDVLDDEIVRKFAMKACADEVSVLLDTIPEGFEPSIMAALRSSSLQEGQKLADIRGEFLDNAYALAQNLLRTIDTLSSGG